MRAVKAFGVFIRLPKPRAALPIRLVDTGSHVNENAKQRDPDFPLPVCGALSLFLL